MSHFTVAVILPPMPKQYVRDAVKVALQPYHEYECTGVKDRYVVKVQDDDYSLESYQKDMIQVLVNTETGNIICDKYHKNASALMDNDNVEEREVPAPDYYKSYEDYLKEYHCLSLDGRSSSLEDGVVYKWTNPNAKWDWWAIGGRWRGFFKSLPQTASGDDLEHHDTQPEAGGASWTNKELSPSGFDIIKKGEIDFDPTRHEFFNKSLDDFKKYQSVVDKVGLESYVTFSKLRDDNPELEISDVRSLYWGQPLITALKAAFDGDDAYKFGRATPEHFCFGNKETFEKDLKYRVMGTYAVLRDEQWLSKGEMGWFGVSSNENPSWAHEWFEIIDGVPDDYWVVCVDCHI